MNYLNVQFNLVLKQPSDKSTFDFCLNMVLTNNLP